MFISKDLCMGEYEMLEREGVKFAGFLLGVKGNEDALGVVVTKKEYDKDPQNGKLLESAGYKLFSESDYLPGMVVYIKPDSEIIENWLNSHKALNCLQELSL